MEFSRPEYWSGQPFPSPVDLPNPGTEPRSPALHGDSLPAEPPGKPPTVNIDILGTSKLKWTGMGEFNSVQFSSVAQSCPTLCDPMNRSIFRKY